MKRLSLVFLVLSCIGCEAIFVEDISNDLVILLAPSENSEVTQGSTNFRWQLLDQADVYQIQIATPSFENASQIVLDSIVESNTAQKMLEAGTYQWRVKALNSDYQTNYSTAGFTVN